MWTPPQDELVEPRAQGAWMPPADEAVEDSAPEDPGVLKSLAAGAMSGVPLAESATAGVQSLLHDTPYAKEHAALEALKDAAWDKHPYAYGTGKTAGMVGTGIVAPAGIPGAIGIGAASGLDQATQMSDVPGDVLKGAAVGGALGTIGEKVINPLISKIPGAAKSVLSSFGKDTTREGVDSYLANPELINSAKGPESQTDVVRALTAELQNHITQASTKARSFLDPEIATNMKELSPLFAEIKNSLMTEGEAGPAQQRAISALSKWEDMLTGIENKNPAAITPEIDETVGKPLLALPAPETSTETLGPIRVTPVADVDSSLYMKRFEPGQQPKAADLKRFKEMGWDRVRTDTGATIWAEPRYLADLKPDFTAQGKPYLSTRADSSRDFIHGNADYYGANVQPPAAPPPQGQISQTALGDVIRQIDANKLNYTDSDSTVVNKALVSLRDRLDQALKLSNGEYETAMKPVSELIGLKENLEKTFALNNSNPDVTSSRLSNVLKDNKSNAQDLLGKLDSTFGSNLVDNAKNYKIQQSFNSGSGAGLRTVLSGLGIGVGSTVGHPWIGGTVGGAIAHNLDGGQIAKSILDMYMSGSKTMADAGVTKALQTFGPMLANAAKAGGNQLAATHFVLATSNPEYQSLIDHAQNNNQ